MALIEITNNNINAEKSLDCPKMSKTSKDENKEDSTNFTQTKNDDTIYQESIKAYQFQIGRYQQFMNYFALFNGALLVAYCSLLTSTTRINTPGAGDKNVLYSLDNTYMPLVIMIAFLGIVASTTWLFSIKGNVAWINNWMKCIEQYKANNPYLLIFSEKVEENNKHLPPNTYFKGYYSTQKLSTIFVKIVILAWCFAFAYAIYTTLKDSDCVFFNYNVFSGAAEHPIFLVFCIFFSIVGFIFTCSLVCCCKFKKATSFLKKYTMSDLSGKIGKKI